MSAKQFNTVQEACDYAVEKIVSQGGRCFTEGIDGDGVCAYGDGKGNHCAIGWLLDHDDKELMQFEGSVMSLAEEGLITDLMADNIEVFVVLQDFHDSYEPRFRAKWLHQLAHYGINTENPAYQKWVDMCAV